MTQITPFDAYRSYLAAQCHFRQTNFDYFKYKGKTSTTFGKFDSRPDKHKFKKLAKFRELEDHLAANLSINANMWVGDLLEDASITRGKSFTKTRNSLTYTFEKDIISFDTSDIREVLLPIEKGDYPVLITDYLNNKVNLATLSILERMLGYTKLLDKQIDDPVLWPSIKKRIIKVFPFYHVDNLSKYRVIFKKHFSVD